MPDEHILFGAGIFIGAAIGGTPWIPLFLLVGASILLDVDHLFYYVWKYRQYNLWIMNKYFRTEGHFENPRIMLPILIFHNIETIILLIILSIFFPLMVYALIGVVLHMILDWIAMPGYRYPKVIKLSLILILLENSRRKRGNPRW